MTYNNKEDGVYRTVALCQKLLTSMASKLTLFATNLTEIPYEFVGRVSL